MMLGKLKGKINFELEWECILDQPLFEIFELLEEKWNLQHSVIV